ncbi:nuclear transport factor 2 family protein [Eudoraea chungangensis]|uniref:nuclear transport factor 2 family protein n=1 Tax=Eudoraea chungangensis TaxID=1481905 RepID=UPI0023EC3895|nr:nuclear transport factor 2 family protein [Eudoraea chungangensis]
MKKIMLTMLLFTVAIGYSQKKNNGKVFDEHPAITVVNEMFAAFIAGDADKVASYLSEDFKGYNGSDGRTNAKGTTKEEMIEDVAFWQEETMYLSLEPTMQAYPDAIEYKGGQVWVQTWNTLKGMHKKTGVKLNMPFHRLILMDEDNKIKTMISYYDERVYSEIGRSLADRENGTIYNHHENINTVRKVMTAFENKDFETAYSYFAEDADFMTLETGNERMTMDQIKERNKGIWETYEVTFDVQGYPDYLEYDLRDGRVVQSWWTARLKRKSDGEKFNVPVLYLHDFDKDGKIVRSSAYYSTKVLDSK